MSVSCDNVMNALSELLAYCEEKIISQLYLNSVVFAKYASLSDMKGKFCKMSTVCIKLKI